MAFDQAGGLRFVLGADGREDGPVLAANRLRACSRARKPIGKGVNEVVVFVGHV